MTDPEGGQIGRCRSTPTATAIERATGDCDRIIRTARKIILCVPLVIAAGVALLLAVPRVTPGLVLIGGGLMGGLLYGVVWHRAAVARSAIRDGPHLPVRAVGWSRPNDGCNYGIFSDPSTPEPDAVLRLPLRREMKPAVDAWAAGSLRPSAFGGVGLFDASGLLATGRIVASGPGLKRWRRRTKPPGRFVQRPPEDWLPPGGQ